MKWTFSLQACQLKSDTITYEEKEQQLVSDCVKELRKSDPESWLWCSKGHRVKAFSYLFFLATGLGESNSQMVSLTDELSQKNEELLRHQEEIAQLLSQIVELQHRVKEVGWLNCCYKEYSAINGGVVLSNVNQGSVLYCG